MRKYNLSTENLIRLGYKYNIDKSYLFKTLSTFEGDKRIWTTIFIKDEKISFEGSFAFKNTLLKELVEEQKWD